MISGYCTSGCEFSKSVTNSFAVYANTGSLSSPIWTLINSNGFILNSNTNQVTLMPDLFSSNPSIRLWQVQLSINADNVTGVSSMIYKTNSLPTNGTCSVSPSSGLALSTYFVISCSGWVDPDGSVTRYDYYGKINV